MAQVYKKNKIEIKIEIPTIWGQGTPSMCYYGGP